MNTLFEATETRNPETIKASAKSLEPASSKGELVVKGVATAVAASAIIQTGKGAVVTLTRHPLVLFGIGVAAGFFAHKYRKEIITLTSTTAEQSKEFILRQKDNIKEMLAESQHEDDGE